MSTERPGNVLPLTNQRLASSQIPASEDGPAALRPVVAISVGGADVDDADTEVVEFVRFCYRRRSVAWPELYDEMCAVAARAEYRGMTYEQLEPLGINFALPALPRLAAMVARVVAEERGRQAVAIQVTA